jgi:DNA-binding PadR family transcriptional regulator
MSIRQGLLALLAQEPMYGYQLRQEFELRTGGTWPLNIGQVYTTLSRLERDGLVLRADGDGPTDDGADRTTYAVTDAGRAEVAHWWSTPVRRESRPRDELSIKLAMAVTVPGVDVSTVVQAQRSDTMRALQDYTRLKANAPDHPQGSDLAWLLVLDSLIFQAEAEVRWLDHCESRLVRAGAERGPSASKMPAPPTVSRKRARR